MNNKEAFIIYKEMCRPILDLSDEELGKVFRWIIENRLDENEVKEPNGNLKIVIGFFKNQFRLDDTKYDEFVEKQRENGLKGGRPKQNPTKPKEPKPFLENPTKPKKPYNENENVNDNVKDKDKKEEDIFVRFINKFNEITGKNFKGGDRERSALNARLAEGFTTKDIGTAILKASQDPYLCGDNEGGKWYLTPEYILRRNKLEQWVNS